MEGEVVSRRLPALPDAVLVDGHVIVEADGEAEGRVEGVVRVVAEDRVGDLQGLDAALYEGVEDEPSVGDHVGPTTAMVSPSPRPPRSR
jgi:hypothetical protein